MVVDRCVVEVDLELFGGTVEVRVLALHVSLELLLYLLAYCLWSLLCRGDRRTLNHRRIIQLNCWHDCWRLQLLILLLLRCLLHLLGVSNHWRRRSRRHQVFKYIVLIEISFAIIFCDFQEVIPGWKLVSTYDFVIKLISVNFSLLLIKKTPGTKAEVLGGSQLRI